MKIKLKNGTVREIQTPKEKQKIQKNKDLDKIVNQLLLKVAKLESEKK